MKQQTRRFMKTTFILAVILAVSTGAAFAAPQFVRIGTGGSGGNFYRLGAGMMALMNEKHPDKYHYSIQATKGTPHNLQLVNDAEVEFVFASGAQAIEAFNNQGSFKNDDEARHKKMSFLFYVYPNIGHFGVTKDQADKINTIADLAGKRVSIGLIGSAGDRQMRDKILPAAGLKYEDIRAEHTVHGGSIDQLRNRQIDAMIWPDGVFSASWTEAADTGLLVFKSFPDNVIDAIVKGTVNFPLTIEANTYPNQPEPFKTWGDPILLVAGNHVSEEVVYDFLKTTFENTQYLVEIMPLAKFINLKDALQAQQFPLHPGAEKFYREAGVLK